MGLIDFMDCVHSYYLFELAILVAHTMISMNNQVELVAHCSDKNYSVSIYYAVLAILCTTVVKGEYLAATKSDNGHMQRVEYNVLPVSLRISCIPHFRILYKMLYRSVGYQFSAAVPSSTLRTCRGYDTALHSLCMEATHSAVTIVQRLRSCIMEYFHHFYEFLHAHYKQFVPSKVFAFSTHNHM